MEQDLTKVNYLRPQQERELEHNVAQLEKSIADPQVAKASGVDMGALQQQLRNEKHMLESQRAPTVSGEDLDNLVKTEVRLREELLVGMPSQEEMRRNPPGAVGKHMGWEKRNKLKLIAWKNAQLILNKGTDDPDVANFERFRPTVSTLNIDNAAIPKTTHYHFPDKIEAKNVMSDDDRDALLAENERLKALLKEQEDKKEAQRQRMAKARAARKPKED